MKMGGLLGFLSILLAGTVIAGLPEEKSTAETLTDYLNDKNVSYLIVKSGDSSKLSTFGWLSAKKGCQNIKSAGFSVVTVRNFAPEPNDMTETVCK